MNNNHSIKLQNDNGTEKEYGQIPDLWHIAAWLDENGPDLTSGEEIREVWHMAHDLKSVVEQQEEAKLLEHFDFRQNDRVKQGSPFRNIYFEIIVAGSGEFPWDQLRRARCYPVSTEDAAQLPLTGRRSVKVALTGNWMEAQSCVDRFKSFGWSAQVVLEQVA